MFKQKKKGITLVALVVTIIVLLILVGVTIALVLGDDGVIQKANQTKVANKYSEIVDLKEIWQNNNTLKRKTKEELKLLSDFSQELLDKGVITSEEKTEIDTNKALDLGYGYIIDFGLNDDSYPEIQIGDIVYYDPTAGVENPETNPLLRYESKEGSSLADGDTENSPGNGTHNKIFQATNQDTKWVVLYKKDGQLILMSEDLKGAISTYKFMCITRAVGYLYAEQELHNICSIYGHRTWCSK